MACACGGISKKSDTNVKVGFVPTKKKTALELVLASYIVETPIDKSVSDGISKENEESSKKPR